MRHSVCPTCIRQVRVAPTNAATRSAYSERTDSRRRRILDRTRLLPRIVPNACPGYTDLLISESLPTTTTRHVPPPSKSSAGLFTPAGPRFSTWV
jgi:hypothetical protein